MGVSVSNPSFYILQDGTESWSSGHFGFLHTIRKITLDFLTACFTTPVCVCVSFSGESSEWDSAQGWTCTAASPLLAQVVLMRVGRDAHVVVFIPRQVYPPPPLKSCNANKKNRNISKGGQGCHGNSVEWPSETVDIYLLGFGLFESSATFKVTCYLSGGLGMINMDEQIWKMMETTTKKG